MWDDSSSKTADIIASLNSGKPIEYVFVELFKAAYSDGDNDTLSVLEEYKKFNENSLDSSLIEVPILGAFTISQVKFDLDKFTKVIPLNKILAHFICIQNTKDTEKLKFVGELITEVLNRGLNPNELINDETIIDLYVLKAHKELFLNHQTNPLQIDNLLKLIAFTANAEGISKEAEVIQHQLIQDAIALGANVNIQIDSEMGARGLLDFKFNKDVVGLLKAHGAVCNVESNRAKSFVAHEKLELYSFGLQKYADLVRTNLDAPKAEINKIPYLVHHVWLTHPQSPREIDPVDIANVLETKRIFENSNKKWAFVVWTNDKSLIPNSVLELERHGVEVKSMYSLREELRLFNRVEELIANKHWGMASDILRYSLVEHLGGVYADLNFEFKRTIEDEMYKFDYFAQDFINNFFAAKPNHPIISNLLDKVESNLETPPPYIASIDDSSLLFKTVYVSLLPFSLAYLEASNLEGNVDIVYPPTGEEYDLSSANEWLEQECASPWSILEFPNYLGICGKEDLLIGQDGINDSHLTWLED